MEFKLGDPERGRTILEKLLTSYPKRSDLWGVWIDQERRLDDHEEIVRNLFERVITLNLSSKKMKQFFKRYLEFEKANGSAARVEHVKNKAREYVQSKSV